LREANETSTNDAYAREVFSRPWETLTGSEKRQVKRYGEFAEQMEKGCAVEQIAQSRRHEDPKSGSIERSPRREGVVPYRAEGVSAEGTVTGIAAHLSPRLCRSASSTSAMRAGGR
jgi:hypothetical protein